MVDAYIIGSVARGTATDASDLDIAIIIEPLKTKIFSENNRRLSQRIHVRHLKTPLRGSDC
ncbi:nucleotidyltransferase domain-containing protein [Pontibacillus sp. ALD_SL1]|uniref:nucleotidyltransferase domain-containing protein n=1 Tax=Pontibacillus sp. ALD_SL1 TaxID=2777185 RepID=UPI0035304B87